MTKGMVKVSMYEYTKLLGESPSDMKGSSNTLTTSHLFNVNPEAKKFPKSTVQLFHHLVAKLLYLSRCETFAFLYTSVQTSKEMTSRSSLGNSVHSMYKGNDPNDKTR